MPLTSLLATQLARLRTQMLSGRPEWQDTTEPVAHIPVEDYTSAAIRDAEVERLFRPLPLIVGHASELRPGQVMAHDDYGVPMLLARDADGVFRAFLNVCRHRGMRLVEQNGVAETRASVVCPYHGWTYRLDGALRHRLHAEAFDRPCAGGEDLVPLPCEERHGLLWVLPTPGAAIDVAAHLRGLDAELPFFRRTGSSSSTPFSRRITSVSCTRTRSTPSSPTARRRRSASGRTSSRWWRAAPAKRGRKRPKRQAPDRCPTTWPRSASSPRRPR
jgi:nitrite reductase/ring-hydroxylating ferredoxin subunit